MFLFLYLCSFAVSFEFNVLKDLIRWYSQSGNKINHVLCNLFSLYSEAATEGVLQRKLFLKISQYSHGTPVLGSHFDKAAGLQLCNFIKKRFQHSCFPVIIAKLLRIPI